MNLVIFPRSARLALITALLALPLAVCAAQEPAPAAKSARPAPEGLISIDFPGGPLSKLVAALGKEANLSIIQSPGLDPALPAFSVHDVRVDFVIAALGRLIEPQGYQLTPVGPNLAVLNKFERHTSQAFASFQLESKLGDGKVEDVITAIQQGCEFANEGKPSTLRFKYHPATKLLFVAGTEMEVDVAHRVYASLPGYPPKGQPAPAEDKK